MKHENNLVLLTELVNKLATACKEIQERRLKR